jgi:RecA/RadA recombinase
MEELKHEKIGAFAKNAKMFAKYLTAESYKRVIHFIMLNHQYDTIGGFGISTKKSTGGEWVSLMPCMRLQTILVKSEKVDNTDVSQLTEIKVIKNDFGSRTTTTVRILLGYGIIPSDEEIEYLMDKGLVIRKGLSAKGFGVAVGSY